ncbi:MAG: hypothetical protein HY923_00650 [Elusimicrobia bacterium]|nr:hypothetical protein [Elusimicrobiota bacterium]
MTFSPTEPSRDKDAEIARLLGELADLTGEEEALAAYRREAEAFEPAVSTESIARALLALEKEAGPP